jgi:hypothetical protein
MKKYGIEIKWGVIFVVVALLWMYFEKWMGWHGENIASHAMFTNFFAIIAILIYVLGLRDKRKNELGGYMTWKQGFISGLIITLVVTIFTPLSQYITHQIISPEYFSNVIDYVVETGNMTRETAEQHFTIGSYIVQSAIFSLVIGAITSAVVALFLKKKAPAETAA